MKTISLMAMFALVGCSAAENGDDRNADDTNEGDGTGGDGLEPTGACLDYLACLEVIGSPDLALAEEAYGAGGSCWAGDAQEALACSTQCETNINLEHLDHAAETACWPDGIPLTSALFTEISAYYRTIESTPSYCVYAILRLDDGISEFELRARDGANFIAEFIGYDFHDTVDLDCEFVSQPLLSFECDDFASQAISGHFSPDFDVITFDVGGTCEVVVSR